MELPEDPDPDQPEREQQHLLESELETSCTEGTFLQKSIDSTADPPLSAPAAEARLCGLTAAAKKESLDISAAVRRSGWTASATAATSCCSRP